MKVLYVKPGEEPESIEMGGSLKELQEAVGGYIEAIYPFEDDVCIICNEEGKLMGLPPNRVLSDGDGHAYDVLCGPFIVAGLTLDNFGSLTDKQMKTYMELFREPVPAVW